MIASPREKKSLPGQTLTAPSKALLQGLEILKLLAGSPRPMTSTEIAKRSGLHQSSASRILRTLIAAGYVRKPGYHCFAADYGVLTLGAGALRQFPLCTRPKRALRALAERCPGVNVSLAALWRGEVLYFLRTQKGQEAFAFSVGYPLHLSSPALRLLLERPAAEARAMLEASRERHGWERPTGAVPATLEACLPAARARIRHDSLVLEDWQGPGRVTAAIPVEAPGELNAALALSGPMAALPAEERLLLLQEGRRAVEAALRGKVPAPLGSGR